MIEVETTHPNLPALFDPKIPNNPILFATLMSHAPGRAWVTGQEGEGGDGVTVAKISNQ